MIIAAHLQGRKTKVRTEETPETMKKPARKYGVNFVILYFEQKQQQQQQKEEEKKAHVPEFIQQNFFKSYLYGT